MQASVAHAAMQPCCLTAAACCIDGTTCTALPARTHVTCWTCAEARSLLLLCCRMMRTHSTGWAGEFEQQQQQRQQQPGPPPFWVNEFAPPQAAPAAWATEFAEVRGRDAVSAAAVQHLLLLLQSLLRSSRDSRCGVLGTTRGAPAVLPLLLACCATVAMCNDVPATCPVSPRQPCPYHTAVDWCRRPHMML
jgi:hypothetical protein